MTQIYPQVPVTDSSLGTILQHPCDNCSKVFSREEFLDFHKDCFHRVGGNKTRIVLVEADDNLNVSSLSCEELETPAQSKNTVIGVSYPEPEELMMSFTKEKEPEQSKNKEKPEKTATTKKSKRTLYDEKSAKETVKRVLRYRK